MPAPAFHLWIAREYAKDKPFLRTNGDYYLGSIAPDAILSRAACTSAMKNATHLLTNRSTWEEDTLHYFYAISPPSPFQIGYLMHVLTDIRFRNQCRAFEDAHSIPLDVREKLVPIAAAIHMVKLFDTLEEYQALTTICDRFTAHEFPFILTREDMLSEISFARRAFETTQRDPMEDDSNWPLPDLVQISKETVIYLNKVMGYPEFAKNQRWTFSMIVFRISCRPLSVFFFIYFQPYRLQSPKN